MALKSITIYLKAENKPPVLHFRPIDSQSVKYQKVLSPEGRTPGRVLRLTSRASSFHGMLVPVLEKQPTVSCTSPLREGKPPAVPGDWRDMFGVKSWLCGSLKQVSQISLSSRQLICSGGRVIASPVGPWRE